jgi:methionyl-tRNA synthetase
MLGTCINIAKILMITLQPIMPVFAKRLKDSLGLEKIEWKDAHFYLKDHSIKKPKMFFEKILEDKEPEFPIDLKVAKITDVKAHPDADKLYVIKLDLGFEKRQIVSGLRDHYGTEDLLGKKIILVSNLKPAKLRGIESQGMLMAGTSGDICKVLEAKSSSPGEQVKIKGYEIRHSQIRYDDFAKIRFEVKDKLILFEGEKLKTDKEDITVDIKDGATVS